MIYLITNRKHEYNKQELSKSGINFCSIPQFQDWLDNYNGPIQLDSETNIVEGVYGWKGRLVGKNFKPELDENGERIPQKRECYVVQFGDYEGENQYIWDIVGMDATQLNELRHALKVDNQKIIHNALFDYVVFKWCFDVGITKIRDTMLMSQVVYTGLKVGTDLPSGYHSLAGCVSRYLGVDISKAEQTGFNGQPMTVEQIQYAATDVVVLGKVHDALQVEVDDWDVENVVRLECALVPYYGDSMIENFYLASDEWGAIMSHNKQLVEEKKQEFFDLVLHHFPEQVVDLGFVQKEDEYKFNWRSSTMKKLLLRLVYPDMPADYTTIKHYKTYLESIRDQESSPTLYVLSKMLDRDYDAVETYYIQNHHDFLMENSLFIPKGTMLLNLNSDVQKLELFKLINPDIKNVNKETLNKLNHPLARKLKEYNKVHKMATSYGQNFLNSIDPDGMFRVKNYKQILNTGRSSMNQLQLLPGQNLYRNPFKPNDPKTGVRKDGYKWKVVGADYSGQELCVLATYADEDAMTDALMNGHDLHSINTAKLFPEEWVALGGDPVPKGKPKDKKLLARRDATKATIFGICYGKSAIGLGESLGIPGTTADLLVQYEEEYEIYMEENKEVYNAFYPTYRSGRDTAAARHEWIKHQHKLGKFLPDIVTGDDMIDRVFIAFPKMALFLNNSAEHGAQHKYVRTPDIIGRVRRFPTPRFSSEEGTIRRAAQNFPIQASSANMTKYAIILIGRYIAEHGYSDRMKFCLPLHDEVRYIAREDFAEEALQIIIDKMEEAGQFILGNNLQKAEGEITDCWEK